MKFVSTRGKAPVTDFSGALLAGLASDGGLYVPETFPDLSDLQGGCVELGESLIGAFAKGSALEGEIGAICREAWNFPTPLKMKGDRAILELFHGPTCAFKDFAARFLAGAITRMKGSGKRRLVLVATSGDTGGAVAAAFFRKPEIEVAVLYPEGKISPRQEKQLAAWGENVRAFAVRGSFDDCQALAKEAFQDPKLKGEFELLSANSINIGRILPQSVYYAWASREYVKNTGKRPGFIIPTGNLGNALAAIWARKLGSPIREIAFALNANRPLADYLSRGKWKPAPSVSTLANAMDVGNPSNFERLQSLVPRPEELKKFVQAQSYSDDQIRSAIRQAQQEWGEVLCPHTATAFALSRELKSPDWILVATAHPAKFETIVEPLVGKKIEVPEALAGILARPETKTQLLPKLDALRTELLRS